NFHIVMFGSFPIEKALFSKGFILSSGSLKETERMYVIKQVGSQPPGFPVGTPPRSSGWQLQQPEDQTRYPRESGSPSRSWEGSGLCDRGDPKTSHQWHLPGTRSVPRWESGCSSTCLDSPSH